jgi:hypothetical protein
MVYKSPIQRLALLEPGEISSHLADIESLSEGETKQLEVKMGKLN